MATVRDIINRSCRLINVLATGEALEAEEANDAFDVLNTLIEDWSTQNHFIFEVIREEFLLTPSKQEYTIGPSGDFNTTRPEEIKALLLQQQGTSPEAELPIKIVDYDAFQRITTKKITSSVPQLAYPSGGFPLIKVSFWPVPNRAEKIVMYSLKVLAAFTGLSQTLSLPTGFRRALEYNLSLELAPEYGKTPSGLVMKHADDSKGNVKRRQMRTHYLEVDPGLLSPQRNTFNWLSGD